MNNRRRTIKQVIVVGGGTAGWLAANHLAKKLISTQTKDVSVTLIESADTPPLGVGEGTVPAIRDSLKYLGISETDLIRECDATFKQSIEFINWRSPNENQTLHKYHHVFDYPQHEHLSYLPHWINGAAEGVSFANAFSIQSHLCDAGLAPKQITQAEYQGVCSYAYHFDATKFGQLLAKHATTKLGVVHRTANVEHVEVGEGGIVKHLVTDSGEMLCADLFVDCTGSRSLLLGQALKVPFLSKREMLFTDTALAAQVPYDDVQQDIPCSTLATAKSAGWVWDIGLTSRRGVGLVYSSSHLSEADAELELRSYLGEAGRFAEMRKIPMRSGYYEKLWQGNCVAIGMSQGFVEPLEATGLLLFDASARMLAELLPIDDRDMQLAARKFNRKLRYAWDKVIDFIKLHYCLSDRVDQDFWFDHRDPSSLSDSLSEDLEYWQAHLPSHYDFTDRASVFNLENYLYVLYGMDFKTTLLSHHGLCSEVEQAKRCFQQARTLSHQLKQQMLPHRELLNRIHKFGLQTI